MCTKKSPIFQVKLLTPQNPSNGQWNINRLIDLLKHKKEGDFLDVLQQINVNSSNLSEILATSNNTEKLLIKAVEMDLTRVVAKMLDLCFVTEMNTVSVLSYACSHGKWKSLDILLKHRQLNINFAPLLSIILKKFGQKQTEVVNFEKCFEVILTNPDIDVNQLDAAHKSPLEYAIKSGNTNAIRKLLERGAYIGVKNEINLSISHIDPKLLEMHFDSCITTNGLLMNDRNFEIIFDFKNLVPARNKNNDYQVDEMSMIEYISKSKHLKRLMIHPLISGKTSITISFHIFYQKIDDNKK